MWFRIRIEHGERNACSWFVVYYLIAVANRADSPEFGQAITIKVNVGPSFNVQNTPSFICR